MVLESSRDDSAKTLNTFPQPLRVAQNRHAPLGR